MSLRMRRVRLAVEELGLDHSRPHTHAELSQGVALRNSSVELQPTAAPPRAAMHAVEDEVHAEQAADSFEKNNEAAEITAADALSSNVEDSAGREQDVDTAVKKKAAKKKV